MVAFDAWMDILDLVPAQSTETPEFISRQVRHGRYVFVNLAPSPATRFTVTCAGREECTADYEIARDGFRYHALEYVVSGRWELTLRGRTHELGPGAVFYYGPRTRYALRPLDRSGLVKFFVDFAGGDANALVRASGLPKSGPRHVGQPRWLHDVLDQILECAALPRSASGRVGSLLTELLLVRLREDLAESTVPDSEAGRTYARCRGFIEENYPAIHSVREVAERCHLDPAYLSRLFRRFADEPPHLYLTRLKMDHAAELIVRRGFAVKQAADAVGYDDPYHFSRVFKRTHGTAPSRFGGR
jgi:AraC-like DNA-binding protein